MAKVEWGTLDSPDVTAEINNNNDLEFKDTDGNVILTLKQDQSISVEDTATETIAGGSIHYAVDYNGADPDVRLDNALSAAVAGDMIVLETNVEYTDNRSSGNNNAIAKSVTLMGTMAQSTPSGAGDSPTLGDEWELTGPRARIIRVGLNNDGQITAAGNKQKVVEVDGRGSAGVVIDANGVTVTLCAAIDPTFNSGTSDGIADTNTSSVVTDNGSNTVGDNS